MAIKGKKKGWFKVCPEKWIHGSTREEMTSAERGVWIDFLALAFMNDPPGQIDFFTYKRLANQLHITVKLLKSTINKALFYEKIKLKEKKSNPTCDQLKTKSDTLGINLSKIGLSLRTIIILNWNEYQSEYLRQKPYREKRKEQEEEQLEESKKLQKSGLKTVSQVTDRGEERRKEEKRKENTLIISPKKISDTDISLTNLLIEKILENDPKSRVQRVAQKRKENWYNECRKLREIDNRSLEDIEAIINWCQEDDFEKTVVLSMPKLRERFDSLWLKYERLKAKIEPKDLTTEEKDWIEGKGKYKDERD